MSLASLSSALIACFEGNRLQAYQDSGGVWTIGIGHTHGVQAGMVITAEQSAAFFAVDQAPLLVMVQGLPIPEAAALVSFGFNVGKLALANVILGKDTIGNPKHTTDRHGNVLPGLVNRRRLEIELIALSQETAIILATARLRASMSR